MDNNRCEGVISGFENGYWIVVTDHPEPSLRELCLERSAFRDEPYLDKKVSLVYVTTPYSGLWREA